jgi:mannosyltransferase OCH1-like enzyme
MVYTIGIFNSFSFHYEMFGFILDYAKRYNCVVDIYTHINNISNKDEGWRLFYEKNFNNFKMLLHTDFNGNTNNYDLFFITTDDDRRFKPEWITKNVISLNHTYKTRIRGFKNYFNIAPFDGSNHEFIYPCYKLCNIDDKKIDDDFIDICIIGAKVFDGDVFDASRLKTTSNKKIRLNIITRYISYIEKSKKYIESLKSKFSITLHINLDTNSMMTLLKKSSYILLTGTSNNDHNTCKSSSGSTQLFLSTLCKPIVCETANRHLKLKHCIEFVMNSNEPIYVDNNVDFKQLELERDTFIHKRNMLLDNILYENKYCKYDIKRLDTIPKRIVQTWERKNIIRSLQSIINSWKRKNPDYEYILYDNLDREQFLEKYFNKDVINAYKTLIPGSFKVDLFRTCELYVNGGFYCDLDSICINSINSLIDNETLIAIPIEGKKNNPIEGNHCLLGGFTLSRNKNPILLRIIHRIIENIKTRNIYGSILDITGPGVVGLETNIYLNREERASFVDMHGIHYTFNGEKIKLLTFELGTEYIKSLNGDILFQNKNGNAFIRKYYTREIEEVKKRKDFKCWLYCIHNRDTILSNEL